MWKVPERSTRISEALLLKQMPKKQTAFVLVIKQNKADLFFFWLKTKNQTDLVFDDEN